MTAFEEMTQSSYLLLIFPFKVLVAMRDVGKYKFIPFLVPFSAWDPGNMFDGDKNISGLQRGGLKKTN